jgi:cytochrome b561
MPYREKTAWLMLLAMTFTFGPYFAMVAAGAGPVASEAAPNFRQLGLFAMTVFLELVILGIGHLYLRRESPDEARTPLDERDIAILHRSLSAAYYVLMAGMILVGCIMPFMDTGWNIVNPALFMIVVAEFVRYGVAVFRYRKQA